MCPYLWVSGEAPDAPVQGAKRGRARTRMQSPLATPAFYHCRPLHGWKEKRLPRELLIWGLSSALYRVGVPKKH
ncbi:hypothetical protein PABY_14570 [Pyrodictium abyssi]|uniref:Uncharacterized protein n=1 Tax=Pyrodictium abyssi TaxID=54256 RepID=A0ABN6ZT79_9CREN|nr:hypothetical protein PABY_14570 [Pyrodictium abyssi]